MMQKTTILSVAAFLFLATILKTNALSETPVPREYIVKAAFLYNFAKFVEWPADAFPDEQSAFVLGIFGEEPFGSSFDSIKHETVGNRKLVIERPQTLEDLKKCHMRVTSLAEKNDLGKI